MKITTLTMKRTEDLQMEVSSRILEKNNKIEVSMKIEMMSLT